MKNKGYTNHYIHVSVPLQPKTNSLGQVILVAGWPHSTYNVGRNKAKRERRERQRQLRARVNERSVRVTD